jgi:hypothetical protein
MLTVAGPIVVVGLIVAALAGLFVLTGAVRRAREAAIERQVRLTDAIHSELGAVATPFVDKPLFGPWEVTVVAPLERPSLVGSLVAIAQRVLRAEHPGDEVRIVLRPQARIAAPGRA